MYVVVTDHFTRYAQSLMVAKFLVEKFFVHYGLPQCIHSDQGLDFENKIIKKSLTMLGIQKPSTTPYHPQGNPQPKQFRRTLLDMLGTLSA